MAFKNERERERERETETETETETENENWMGRERPTERHKEIKRQIHNYRKT